MLSRPQPSPCAQLVLGGLLLSLRTAQAQVAACNTAQGGRTFLVYLLKVSIAFLPCALTCSAVLAVQFLFNNSSFNIFKLTH